MNRWLSVYFNYVKGRTYLLALIVLVLSVFLYVVTDAKTSKYVDVLHVTAAGLIPIGVLGLLWDFFAKHEFLEYTQKVLDELLDGKQTAARKDISRRLERLRDSINGTCHLRAKLAEHGVIGIYPDRSSADLPRLLSGAKRRIWIQVTSFSYLTETAGLLEVLKERAGQIQELVLLGLAADSDSARLRSAFSESYRYLEEEIPVHLRKLESAFCQGFSEGGIVRLFLYDKIPTAACFLVDDKVLICPLLCSRRGRSSVHLLIGKTSSEGRQSKLFAEYEDHLTCMMHDSKLYMPDKQ